jgi:adenine deaminase
MAIAGGACSAYSLQVRDGELVTVRSFHTLRSECPTVEEAVRRLRAGETVMVAGSDMQAVRRQMQPQEHV